MSTGRSRLTMRVTSIAEMVGEKAQVSQGEEMAMSAISYSSYMCSGVGHGECLWSLVLGGVALIY